MVTSFEAVSRKFPAAVPLRDFAFADKGDGNGPSLSLWNESVLGPKPTPEQIEDWRANPAPDHFVPVQVSTAQFRAALIMSGVKPGIETDCPPGSVLYALQQIPDQLQRDLAVDKWLFANYIERAHPLIVAFAAGFGLTSDQVDALFRQAATL